MFARQPQPHKTQCEAAVNKGPVGEGEMRGPGRSTLSRPFGILGIGVRTVLFDVTKLVQSGSFRQSHNANFTANV